MKTDLLKIDRGGSWVTRLGGTVLALCAVAAWTQQYWLANRHEYAQKVRALVE